METKKIELGDEVMDTITGFKGVAIGRTTWIHGCSRITIQSKVKKDGTMLEPQNFDEPQLKLTKRKKVKRETDTGGFDMEIKQKQALNK